MFVGGRRDFLLAIQGQYENGQITLPGEKPEGAAEVLVIFDLSKEK